MCWTGLQLVIMPAFVAKNQIISFNFNILNVSGPHAPLSPISFV